MNREFDFPKGTLTAHLEEGKAPVICKRCHIDMAKHRMYSVSNPFGDKGIYCINCEIIRETSPYRVRK